MPLDIQYICVGITNCFTLFYRELIKGDFVGSFFPLCAVSVALRFTGCRFNRGYGFAYIFTPCHLMLVDKKELNEFN